MANAPIKKAQGTVTEAGKSTSASIEYYRGVSGKFRAAKFVTILILIVFLVFSFAFLRKDITLENLRFLLKFISFTNTETSITAARINYASGDPNRLELFLGDLATLTPSGYSLYDSRGNQIMSEAISYASPTLKVGERYALCYDTDGYSYTILNSFAKLHDGITDYPITTGAVSNKGYFAIAAASREYRTAVSVYNDDFKAVTKIYKNDHLMDMEFSPDSTTLALMTSNVSGGEFYTKIELVSSTSDEIFHSTEISGLGYNFYFTQNGYVVITDEGIIFLDSELSTVKEIINDNPLSMTDCSGKYLTCIYSKGVLASNSLARVYTPDGKLEYEGSFTDKLISVDSDDSGDYVFLLTGTTLTRINFLNKKIGAINVSADAVDMLAQGSDSVLVALKNYALTYELSDFNEHYYVRHDKETDTKDTISADTEITDDSSEQLTPPSEATE